MEVTENNLQAQTRGRTTRKMIPGQASLLKLTYPVQFGFSLQLGTPSMKIYNQAL